MINENGLLNIFPTAEASGSIVSFENGADGIPMESLSAVIEPIQDLHGYSHPWPAGGGDNILTPPDNIVSSVGITVVNNGDGTYAFSGTATSLYSQISSPFVLPAGSYYFSGSIANLQLYIVAAGTTTTLVEHVSGNASAKAFTFAEDTNVSIRVRVGSGSAVSGTIKPMISKKNTTTFSPYSNICPITGRTGLSVYRTGKNLLDVESRTIAASQGDSTIRTENCTATKSGDVLSATITGAWSKLRLYNSAWHFKHGNTYTISAYFDNPSGNKVGICYLKLGASSSQWTTSSVVQTSGKVSMSFTYDDSWGDMVIAFIVNNTNSSTNNSVTVSEMMIELGSTATAYEQYNGNTYAVEWSTEAGTVYGGTLDVVTGVLTVTRKVLIADGTQTVFSTSSDRFYITVSDAKVVNASNQTTYAGVVCDRLPSKTWASLINGGIGCSPVWGAGVAFKNPNITTVEDWNTYFTNNPTQFSYELETPLTYQLTAQEVTTLLGANRVWSDAGDISLVYRTQADATPSSIDGLFINGEGLQADGWFLKWRKLAAPKPKTDYVSVWGRDGDIDLTESETDGQVFYENRELTMDMVYMGENWTDAYSELLDMLHGKECAVQFSNDPYWYWAGRIIASLYEHKPHSLTMSGIMFPYKLSVAKVTRSATVSGAIESNGVEVVLPNSRMRVSPKVTVVAGTGESVTLKWGTKTQTLSAGTYYVRGLKVGSDDVTIKVWGTGTVTFEYRKGML